MKTRKKFLGYCEQCKKSLCKEHAYFFIDGNNIAITNSSPYLCKSCYEQNYNTKLKDEVQVFKENLTNNLYNLKNYHHLRLIDIDKVIEYIKNF